ncbi:hypothetical protein MSG28_007635 [Choristoneura fumiferana]|uniref:Uncharacterized protein n=1 Tax=Choristoneura fumiferana TaxID=7141 RepID=A0ACC0JY22_CHOFU|nr:hypothetical protein MSG28_007635 [Choristoneura fumiferana]
MFCKILTIIALVKICSGGAPTYPLEDKLKDKSNQASYSQSFVRQDIPLSYQYSAVHVYSPKQDLPKKASQFKVQPLPSVNKPALNPISYPVQYAPIPYKREDPRHQNEAGLYTKVTSPKYYEENEVPESTIEPVKKFQLQPELELSNPTRRPPPPAFNQFFRGHNIEVMPTPNRSPVSNNYHKVNPQTLQEHPDVENYLRQFTIRPETERPVTVSTFRPRVLEYITLLTTENPTKPPFAYVPAEYYHNFQRSFQPKESDIQRLSQPQVLQPMQSRAKDTKLQLNVARGHKVAQMPHQAHQKHGHYHSYPLHTEVIYEHNPITISDIKSPQNVTRLFPMTNHLQNVFVE